METKHIPRQLFLIWRVEVIEKDVLILKIDDDSQNVNFGVLKLFPNLMNISQSTASSLLKMKINVSVRFVQNQNLDHT